MSDLLENSTPKKVSARHLVLRGIPELWPEVADAIGHGVTCDQIVGVLRAPGMEISVVTVAFEQGVA